MKSIDSGLCTLLVSERVSALLGDGLQETAALRFVVAPAEELRHCTEGDGWILCAEDGEELTHSRQELQLLLLAPSSLREEMARKGVMVCSPEDFETALPLLAAACVHARLLRARGDTMERKLEDARVVTRAKLLLMTRLGMTEAQAHRYIEKSAMDTGTKRREVAQRIIRTYED